MRRFSSRVGSGSDSGRAVELGTPNSVPAPPSWRSTISTPRAVAGGENATFARFATLA